MKVIFEEDKFLPREITFGTNDKIPPEILKGFPDLQKYRNYSPDGAGKFLYLMNGKPGIFCLTERFLAILVTNIFESRIDEKVFNCSTEILFYDRTTKDCLEVMSVKLLRLSKKQKLDKTKINFICSVAKSCMKRAASIMQDGNLDKLRTFTRKSMFDLQKKILVNTQFGKRNP